jgi:hypothetical protein
MSPAHNIVDLILKRGLSRTGESILVGLVLTNGLVSWGVCDQLADVPSAIQSLQQKVVPLLQNQPLQAYTELVVRLDKLSEIVTLLRPAVSLPAASANNGPRTISRRHLITGLLTKDEPEMEELTVTQPLPPALRFGVSQAMLRGFALSQNKSLVAALAELYQVRPGTTAVPLQVDVQGIDVAIMRPVLCKAAAVAYRTDPSQHEQTLGANAERLQAHVREVKSWLMEIAPTAQPAIHLDIQGGFTDLYQNDEGKILGALYGLEQAAKPHKLVIENIIKGDAADVTGKMNQIRSYLGFRKMSVKLAAGYTLFPPEALEQFVPAKCVHQIHLNLSQFGSISQVMALNAACQAQGIEVIIHDDGCNVETATAVAQAACAHSLSGPPHLLYNETLKIMDRKP